MRKTIIVFPLLAWGLLAALSYSFGNDSHDACTSDALWTTGWFFAPPLLALPGFAATRPIRAGSVLASVALLCSWALFLFVWFISAISCGGG